MTSIAEKMKPYRERIDALDELIIELLVRRTDIIREVAYFKHDQDIPAVLEDRVIEVRERASTLAADKGLDEETIRQMYQLLIDYSCNLEEEIMRQLPPSEGKQDKKVAAG